MFTREVSIDEIWTPAPGKALVLRSCIVRPNGTLSSFNGFSWSSRIGDIVVAPDWVPDKNCGHGLHGLFWGSGDTYHLQPGDTKRQLLIVEVDEKDVVDLDGKVKFPHCRIVWLPKTMEEAKEILTHFLPKKYKDNQLNQTEMRSATEDLSKFSHCLYNLDLENEKRENDEKYASDELSKSDSYRVDEDLSKVNVISSMITETKMSSNIGHRYPHLSDVDSYADLHTFMIDLDVPAKLVPSSTPGHSHLYVDVPMSWEQLKNVLRALAAAGIIEEGYAEASIKKGATCLRLPWVKKGGNKKKSLVPIIDHG